MSGNSANAPVRAVLDTNQVVSGVIVRRGSPLALITAWTTGRFQLLMSEPILAEYSDVLRRPRLLTAHGVPRSDIDAFLNLVATSGIFVTPAETLPVVIRDPKDNHLLAAALGGHADFLITGDQDLLVLADDRDLGHLKIVTVVEFLAALTAPAADSGTANGT